MAKRHYADIHATHSHMTALMQQIQLENSLARKHMKELEHEKIVLDERKMVGISIPTTWLVFPFQQHGWYFHSNNMVGISIPTTWLVFPFQQHGWYFHSNNMVGTSIPTTWLVFPFQQHGWYFHSNNMVGTSIQSTWLVFPFQQHGWYFHSINMVGTSIQSTWLVNAWCSCLVLQSNGDMTGVVAWFYS